MIDKNLSGLNNLEEYRQGYAGNFVKENINSTSFDESKKTTVSKSQR